MDQTEITGLTTTDWQQPMWKETTLLTDRAVQFATSKTYVFLTQSCVWEVSVTNSRSLGKQDQLVLGNTLSLSFGSDRRGADGVRVDKFPRIHFVGNSRRDSKDDDWHSVWTEQFQYKTTQKICELPKWLRGLIMSMYNNIDRTKRGNKENCVASAFRVTEYARRSPQGRRSFLGPGSDKFFLSEPILTNWMENGRTLRRKRTSCISCHQCFGKRRIEKAKEKEWTPFTSTVITTLNRFLAQLFSVHQLSIHGAVADLCKELAGDSSSAEKPAANDNLESMVFPTEFHTANPTSQTDAEVQNKLVAWIRAEIGRTSWTTEIDPTLLQCCFLEEHWERTVLHYPWWWSTWRDERIKSRVHLTSKWGIIPRWRIRGNTKIGLVLDVKVCHHQGLYGVVIMIETELFLGFASWTESTNTWPKRQKNPVASVENGCTWKLVAKSKPRPKPTFLLCRSLSWTKMDRRWSRKIQPRLFWNVKIHDQIAATWRSSSSRRWWSSKIWRLGRKVQGKIWEVLHNGQLKLGSLSWQKEDDRR